jgi:fatty-acyl-CoA synthase
VIAVPRPKWQERPLVLIMLNPDSATPPSEETLYDSLRQTFEKWQLPEDFVYVETIPKTSVGKFDKKVIRTRYHNYQFSEQ